MFTNFHALVVFNKHKNLPRDFLSQKEVLHLNIVEISLQKSSYIASVNAFCTARHLATCNLVAYGRTAIACHHMIWLHSQTTPSTPSLLVPQLSTTSTTLHNWIHLPWHFPAVTLICLMCNRLMHTYKTKHYHFLSTLFCTLKHQSIQIWILHPLSQPLLQRARRN